MGRPEATFRSEFNALIRPLRPVSVENMLTTPGLPDVCHIFGWAEIKISSKWPVKDTTPLRIDHYTDQQRKWAQNWVEAGGSYRLVCKVAGEWFVFKVPDSLEVGKLTRAEMVTRATFHSKFKPSRAELIQALKD